MSSCNLTEAAPRKNPDEIALSECKTLEGPFRPERAARDIDLTVRTGGPADTALMSQMKSIEAGLWLGNAINAPNIRRPEIRGGHSIA
jgi:hypothetical protein